MSVDQSHTIVPEPPRSSVEVRGMAKGPPAMTVKVYDDDARSAMDLAIELYQEGTTRLTELYQLQGGEG